MPSRPGTKRKLEGVDKRELQPLSPTSVIAQSDGLVQAAIDNEIVLLSIADGTCYGLNRVGSRIWNLLAAPARIGDLCATLLAEYRIDPGACERQVLDLLEELRTEGLVAASEEK